MTGPFLYSPFDDFSQFLVRKSFALSKKTSGKNIKTRDIHSYTTSISNKDVGKRWFLLAGTGAWSEWHIDAAGFCTFIEMKKGVKLWITLNDSEAHPATWPEDRAKPVSTDVDAIVLREGDLL